jgi:hypothetical protein
LKASTPDDIRSQLLYRCAVGSPTLFTGIGFERFKRALIYEHERPLGVWRHIEETGRDGASGTDIEVELTAIANALHLYHKKPFNNVANLLDSNFTPYQKTLLFTQLAQVREFQRWPVRIGYCYMALHPESTPWAVPPVRYFEWDDS